MLTPSVAPSSSSKLLMRTIVRAIFWMAALTVLETDLTAGPILTYEVQRLGSTGYGAARDDLFRYRYSLVGFDWAPGIALEIDFQAGLYGSVSNGGASPGFEVVVLQPDNPPGAAGLYSAMATVTDPSPGPFYADVRYIGQDLPGRQSYSLVEYDTNLNLVEILYTGSSIAGIPEPDTFAGCLFAALAALSVLAVRRASSDPSDR